MFTIRNSADKTEIDIIGAIGEDWFGEGNTLETVRNQFTEITNDITVNISSLGGDLIHALAIHDLFKMSNAKVTVNVIGSTASAGTIIAMGGDEIKISENSLFLGHKASLMAWGNADDLRNAADDLDKFDSRIIAIYKKKTKKTKAEIENWLKEDKWITAEEAKAFGLVDEIYKPKKVLNSAELAELSKIHELPQNFIQMDNNDKSLKETILNAIGFKSDEQIKIENETLKTKVTELEGKVVEVQNAATLTSEIETLKGEITNKATELDSLKAELETAKTEIQNKATEIERLKANGLAPNPNPDPNPTGEPKILNEGQKILSDILASVPDTMKMIYANKDASN